jgi:hypothetical protein
MADQPIQVKLISTMPDQLASLFIASYHQHNATSPGSLAKLEQERKQEKIMTRYKTTLSNIVPRTSPPC